MDPCCSGGRSLPGCRLPGEFPALVGILDASVFVAHVSAASCAVSPAAPPALGSSLGLFLESWDPEVDVPPKKRFFIRRIPDPWLQAATRQNLQLAYIP
mmetsp:Transcript_32017/g.73109  ORF Transcript_32017/g.73109 Transcript_32017/m.73109 type:complete len:99 (-) Transcript_32017:18-314(-)